MHRAQCQCRSIIIDADRCFELAKLLVLIHLASSSDTSIDMNLELYLSLSQLKFILSDTRARSGYLRFYCTPLLVTTDRPYPSFEDPFRAHNLTVCRVTPSDAESRSYMTKPPAETPMPLTLQAKSQREDLGIPAMLRFGSYMGQPGYLRICQVPQA